MDMQLQIKFYHYLDIIKEQFYCCPTYKDIFKIIKEKCNITCKCYHYHCAKYLLYNGLKLKSLGLRRHHCDINHDVLKRLILKPMTLSEKLKAYRALWRHILYIC